MKQNYAEYHFSKTEILKYLIQSILLCGAMDYLFYQNWWLMLLTVPVTVLFMRLKKKGLIRERKRKLNYQFKDALNALSVAVQAGYSVENAVVALFQGPGETVSERDRYREGVSLHRNTAQSQCSG